MDLALLSRVLWRHKIIVGVGYFCALALAFLSYAKVSYGHNGLQLHHRQHEQWQSIATLLVSRKGFPVGRTASSAAQDPTTFSTYAMLYAHLAVGDPVRKLMAKEGPWDQATEQIGAAPVLSIDANTNSAPLPLVEIWTIADPASRAIVLTKRLTHAFIDYLDQEQATHGIPQDERVTLSVVNDGSQPLLLKKRSKTLPIVVFLTVALATSGLAFMVENLRRRRHPVPLDAKAPAEPARRSA